MRILLALGCAFILAPVAAAAEAPKKASEEKVVCKRVYEADTGSHFRSSKRVCMKASDWEQVDRETDEAMRNYRDNARPGAVPSTQGVGGGPQ